MLRTFDFPAGKKRKELTTMLYQTDFNTLAQQYMDMVYRIALNSLRNPADAEDVTQNVFFRLYRSKPSFETDAHARHWLIRVAINESRRLLAAPWRSKETELKEIAAPLQGLTEQHRALFYQVMELPVKYRIPLYLYYYEGYSVKEIAELLRRRPSTVQTQLARGREKLKEFIMEEGGSL